MIRCGAGENSNYTTRLREKSSHVVGFFLELSDRTGRQYPRSCYYICIPAIRRTQHV
jgi:hypothetical protein